MAVSIQTILRSSLPRGDAGFVGSVGFTGSIGFTGSQGPSGNFGGVTFDYTFLSNTDSSQAPGDGNLKFNDTDMLSATALYIDDTDDNSVNLDNYLATIDASTSELRGHFRITRKSNPEDFVIFAITDVSVDAGEYYIVACAFVSGQLTDSSSSFEDGDDILITFARTGDKGDTGFVGSQGYTGSQGDTGFVGSQGDIGYTGSQGDTGFVGSQGANGSSVRLVGSLADQSLLPVPYGGDIGDGYLLEDTGHLWIWNGQQWNDIGKLAGDVGPTGFTGSQGDTGYTGSQGYTGSVGESTFTWGPTPPLNPDIGARWYDTTEGVLTVYVDDGDSQQWVEVNASGFLGQTGYTGSASSIGKSIAMTIVFGA